MDAAAGDVVTPRLVEVAKVFLGQCRGAVLQGRVLLVDSRACGLNLTTQPLDGISMGRRPGEQLCPPLEVGDPGVVLDDGAVIVEAPEGNL